jgi:hypothetical protein
MQNCESRSCAVFVLRYTFDINNRRLGTEWLGRRQKDGTIVIRKGNERKWQEDTIKWLELTGLYYKICETDRAVSQNMWNWQGCITKYVDMTQLYHKITGTDSAVLQNNWNWQGCITKYLELTALYHKITGTDRTVSQNNWNWQGCITK